MSKAKEFRTITDEVIDKRKKQAEEEMNKFWSESLVKLERCAHEGRNYGYIEIPCRFDVNYILGLVEVEEFRHEAIAHREYKITW